MPILNLKKKKLRTIPLANSPEDLEFREKVSDFCDKYKISQRQLAEMVAEPGFRRGTAHRFFNLDPQISVKIVEKIRPKLYSIFNNLLEDLGRSATEIYDELEPIFGLEDVKSMLFNRCELIPEACRFFGFKHDPFDVDRMPSYEEIFTFPKLDNVVERVTDAVIYQRFVAVVGKVGTGKTLLKQRVSAELKRSNRQVRILYPEFFDMSEVNVAGIAFQILAGLEQTIPYTKIDRVNKIRKVLTSMRQDDISVALFLDECHRLNDKVLSALKNFWEMNDGAFSRLMGVVLFGQPAFMESRLRDVKFREIQQRVQIIEMPEMDDVSQAYLAHRIQNVGGNINEIFSPDALKRICQNANTPLSLGNLTNEALMHAFNNEEKRVETGQTFFKKLREDHNLIAIRSKAA